MAGGVVSGGGVVSSREGGDEPRAASPKPAWPLLPQAQLQINRPPPRLFPPSRPRVFLSRLHPYTCQSETSLLVGRNVQQNRNGFCCVSCAWDKGSPLPPEALHAHQALSHLGKGGVNPSKPGQSEKTERSSETQNKCAAAACVFSLIFK